MSRNILLHKKDIILNKKKLKSVLDKQGIDYTELHKRVVDTFVLDLTYKGFMSLMSNRSSWKFLYAIAIIDVLRVDKYEIFDIVDVDTDKKMKEKKAWMEKYQK